MGLAAAVEPLDWGAAEAAPATSTARAAPAARVLIIMGSFSRTGASTGSRR